MIGYSMVWSVELDLLNTTGWLTDTPDGFRDAVLSRCQLRRVPRGDYLYRAGDPPGGIFGLVKGSLGIEVLPDNDLPLLALAARPGFWVGEGAPLTRKPRYISARALTDSLLAYLSLPRWDEITRKDPEAWRWYGHLLLRNELLAIGVASALLMNGSTARVAAMLTVLAGQGPHAAGEPIEIALNQEDLAQLTNLSRSSAGRILKAFAAAGLIELSYRQIRILDPRGLEARSIGRVAGSSLPLG